MLRARVPLYRGMLPEAGNASAQVSTALQQLVADKGVTASVSYQTVEPTTAAPRRVINFTIDDPSVRIGSVAVSGVPASISAADWQRFTQRLSGSAYNEGLTSTTVEDRILGPLFAAGDLNARLTDVHRTPHATSTGVTVDYAAHLEPGPSYKVASLAWASDAVYTSGDFAKDATLHPGDVASAFELNKTEGKIVAAFRAQGYLDAYVVPSPTRDDNNHTVDYAMHAVIGPQYRLHSVKALNLSPEAQAEFERGWTMKPNDVYSELYIAKFLNNNTALQHLARYTASFQAAADPQTHLVDLTITFVPPTGR